MAEGRAVNGLECGNVLKGHFVGGRWYHHVEGFLVDNLQQLLQLALVVLQIALLFHHGVFVLGALGGELRQFSLAHLTYFHHRLAALFVLFRSGRCLFVHLDGLGCIENLYIQLGNLLLQLVGYLCGVEFSLLFRNFVQLNLVAVLVAVPKQPVGIHTVGTVVIDLVDGTLHIAVLHRRRAFLRPGTVGEVLRR